ncbi:MAG TPA: hypothetical protein PKA11_10200, partial [Accumulibacter sp.]|nr:hypothetical protein [Accumulibacter sp.]
MESLPVSQKTLILPVGRHVVLVRLNDYDGLHASFSSITECMAGLHNGQIRSASVRPATLDKFSIDAPRCRRAMRFSLLILMCKYQFQSTPLVVEG